MALTIPREQLLQQAWDQFKEALAKEGIRPWDRFEEKDDRSDRHESMGRAWWYLPEQKRASIEYVTRGGRPDDYIFWTDCQGTVERDRLDQNKAVHELKSLFGYVRDMETLNLRVLQPAWDQFKEALAQAGIRPWDRMIKPLGICTDPVAEWDLPDEKRVQVDCTCAERDRVQFSFWDKDEKSEFPLDQAQVMARLREVLGDKDTSNKRKSPSEEEPAIDLTTEEEEDKKKTDWLAQVHAECAKKKMKAEKDKAQAMNEVMKMGARADTTANLLKKYGVYDQVAEVVVGPETYPDYTCWQIREPDVGLWVSHKWCEKEEAAEVTVKGKVALQGTIQECVRAVAALLKVPESK